MSTTEKQLPVLASHASNEATSEASGNVELLDASELSPYVQFFDAIERLEDDCALFGSASLEATISRARVGRLREMAVAEWRQRQAA